jgi:ADP-heptose:LPS heptosyltransferase
MSSGCESSSRLYHGRRAAWIRLTGRSLIAHCSLLIALKQPALTAICWLLGAALGPWSRRRPLPPTVQRAVFIRPCCLGDVLLTTAAVRAVAEALPAAQLDYLVGRAAAPGLINNPRLAEAIELAPGPRGYLAALRRLRAGRYDLALVFDRAPQWALLPFLAGVPVRAGLDSLHRGLGLTHRVRPAAGQHEVDLAAGVVRALGLPVADLTEEYAPSAAGRARAADLLAEAAPNRPRVALHPAGGVNPGMTLLAKRWPPERFAALIARLGAAGATPILTGAPADRGVADAVLAALPPDAPRPLDLTGRLDLDGHAALAAQCDLYVGHDSGPTHLATAVGTPTVVIFGPTSPAIYAPPGAHVRPVWRGARLDAAIDLRRQRADVDAILAVTVDDVWAAAVDLLPALATTPARPGASR